MAGLPHHVIIRLVATVVITIVVLFIVHNLTGVVVRRLVKKSKGETKLDTRKRANTITAIVRTTLAAIIWMSAVCTFLGILGVNVAALLTGAGIIGVFVGLSAQNTVKDLLAGMFILFEKQYRVGDVITLTGGSTAAYGPTGTVEEITLRITKLRDNTGKLITVRNGEPTVIVNQTNSYASIVLDVVFTYETNISATQKVINQVGAQLMKDKDWAPLFSEPIMFLRVDSFTETGVVIRSTGMVTPASQWDVAGEYRKRLLTAIAKHSNVQLAYAQNS